MANATEYAENADYAMPTAERHTPNASHQVTLQYPAIEGSVSIAGMEETAETTVAAGMFKVTTTSDADPVTTITFNEDFNFENVEIIYEYKKTVQEAVIDNKSSAIGEASLIYPVYASNDECPKPGESSILGYWVVKVFRARITTQPGMDTSYKTAATFNFVLSALDAKRNDEGAYSTAYFRN